MGGTLFTAMSVFQCRCNPSIVDWNCEDIFAFREINSVRQALALPEMSLYSGAIRFPLVSTAPLIELVHEVAVWLIETEWPKYASPSLVKIIVCRLFGAKPLSEPMLYYCQLEPKELALVELYFICYKSNIFIKKMRLKMSSGKCRIFCLGLNVLHCQSRHHIGRNRVPYKLVYTWMVVPTTNPDVVYSLS